MSHVREQIRDKVVARLTGLTTTGARVYASRSYPLDTANLPGLLIYTATEEIDTEEGEIGTQERAMTLVVEGYARVTGGLDDDLDEIAEEVDTAIFTDPYFDNLAKGCLLESTEIDFDDAAEAPTGVITMNWRIVYFTREGTPGTAI